MKSRMIILLALFAIFIVPAAADSGTKIKYWAVKATKSGSIPDDIEFMKREIEKKGFKGVDILKSGTGENKVEYSVDDYSLSVTAKAVDGKLQIVVKKGDETLIDASVPLKKRPIYIWGPEVEGGQVLLCFKKG